MANGAGVVEEVLVKGRWDGAEIEKGIPESVDKGVVAAGKALTDAQKRLVNYGKALKEGGANLQDLATEFKNSSASAADMRVALQELGYSTGEINSEFKRLNISTGETESAFTRVAGAVKFAVFRFFTALIIYQALRKVIRSVSEAIQEALRLWKELIKVQQELSASLRVNQAIIGEQVGTLRSWNEWIEKTADTWVTTTKAVTEATSAALQANTTLRLSEGALRDIIKLGRSAAQMWGFYKDGQLDAAKGVDLVTRAMRGEEKAMEKLGVTMEDVLEYTELTAEEFEALPRALQEGARHAFIMDQRFDDLNQTAADTQSILSAIDAVTEEQTTKMGEFAAGIQIWMKFAKLGFITILNAARELYDLLQPVQARWGEFLKAVLQSRLMMRLAQEAQEGLTQATEEGADAAVRAAQVWTRLKEVQKDLASVFEKAAGIMERVTGRVGQAIREGFEAVAQLGRDIGDAVRDNLRSVEDAARSFSRRMADLVQDLARQIDRLNRRFAARAAELVLRAEERKEDIREDFRQREENERDNLNLRLKHMEEDFLLDMKHMREQYEMDIEEAARNRDAVAIRTLQRRYGLEKRQRTEDYQLQRKQFIESWEQRHKQRKKDLEDELQEVEDNLQKQLEALERERQRELEEIKIRHAERQEELRQQYAQELEDLQRNLERRLADILTAAIQEGVIRIGEASKVTSALATLYGIDMQNLETMIHHDMEWLNAWASAWEAAIARIARARATIGGISIGEQRQRQHKSFAKGGTAIATRPTLVKVGEAGPELFTAIPLAKGGSVIGGLRNYMGGDFNLTIDGDQSALWSDEFEQGVTSVVADMFREAFQD